MTIISKLAGGLGLFSNLRDIHKTAVVYSNQEYQKVAADTFIASSINAQKTDRMSPRDAERKTWFGAHNFLGNIKEPIAKTTGYIKGFAQGVITRAPSVALSALALCIKNKTLANISAIGLAVVEVFDFLKYSTSLFVIFSSRLSFPPREIAEARATASYPREYRLEGLSAYKSEYLFTK